MTRTEILRIINAIFINVLDDDTVVLTEETTANDVDEWDSLNHIQLVVAIEKHFKIRFASQEILSWQNIGEMVSSVEGKVN